MAKIVVTGATGFVGRALLPRLLAGGHEVIAVVRNAGAGLPTGVTPAPVGDLAGPVNWAPVLEGAQALVHLAGLAHQRNVTPTALQALNVTATVRLAQAAQVAGLRRLVYVSSVKAQGDHSPGRPLTELDPALPEDAYGESKRAAEEALTTLCPPGGPLSLAILRPPLVHGPGVKANMAALLRLATRWPVLPLGGISNRRSLVSLDTLADAITRAVERDDITGTFLVADQPALSTSSLVATLAAAAGKRPWLLPLPAAFWSLAGHLPGLSGIADRLTGSLEIDDTAFRDAFDWHPPLNQDEALARTVRAYLHGTRSTL
ncbi:NAD-dependent epimerase/dehydratase family protein [Nitrospirillum sp. BR 11163]|uniref:NAD-dependent epimerase/dehydratase family protein n=1 Tax=Nitrospirillum sp. BR 11163 TaxID=3104323 RepID=UPI002B002FF4|nr:NAD-dependent epimerase/dehydratase family protein [Nitrospirillum sp. BR 11163]MEA1674219.1 NAD-dependent epimerase/dehydratase family protein [Nitrospirillum sp. BR 11163]